MTIEKMKFNGTFRDYQQRVIDNSDQYLKDGKINIVAAPGSGKTVLGLELIRKLGKPCIIFSPTAAIREQWGYRLRDLFLEDKADFPLLFSSDPHDIKPITSITYQSLYTAVAKISEKSEEGIDCSDMDIFKAVKENGIKTICLDEAHHLKNEWQKALEKFINGLNSDVKIISLTATPPYDSDASEWERYINVCGEIDEEIFIPELVAQNTLCPHQDYVYFNFPSSQEAETIKAHRQNAAAALDEMGKLGFWEEISKQIEQERNYDKLYSHAKEYISLLVLLEQFGVKIQGSCIRRLAAKNGLPRFGNDYAETGLQFLMDENMLDEEQRAELTKILEKHSLYEKRKVRLSLTEKLRRTIVSSAGKLESIKQISKNERASLGDSLRLLILTDYIKKNYTEKIATDELFSSVNVVSIFETLRRSEDKCDIGVLSGSLVILPENIDLSDIKCSAEKIEGTNYKTVRFAGSVKAAVEYVSKLFEKGAIKILIGTKSLLGEGWDSPCVNSLILASFVGSFVLSNQMRGRAIRTDKTDPEKVANIWHLVTVEPDYMVKEKITERFKGYVSQNNELLESYDFETLKRRFDTFMGPDYETDDIESGISRIKTIKPPYNKKGIEEINKKTLELSSDRKGVKAKWQKELSGENFGIVRETSVPYEKRVPPFTFFNFALYATVFLIFQAVIVTTVTINFENITTRIGVLIALAEITILAGVFFIIKKTTVHFNPAKSIKILAEAIYETLIECELISPASRLESESDKSNFYINLYIKNASVHDQNIFNNAVTEMLSPINNPRYIIIKKYPFGIYGYVHSFACPSVIGTNKKYAEILTKQLKKRTGTFVPVYTRTETGRKLIIDCRKRSYITFNRKSIDRKYKISRWE